MTSLDAWKSEIIQPSLPARLDPGSSAATGAKAAWRRRTAAIFSLPNSRKKIVILLSGFALLVAIAGIAQESSPSEYQIKAAFIYNFAKFAEWPADVFSSSNSPIVIGVFGKNVFGNDLERTVRNKTIGARPIECRELGSLAEVTNCNILFVSTSEKDRLSKIFKQLNGSRVLTVAEMDHFTDAGGMINIFMEGNKVRFQINNDEVVKAGIKIDSRLLSLAASPAH